MLLLSCLSYSDDCRLAVAGIVNVLYGLCKVLYSETKNDRHTACVFMFSVLQADKGMVCEQLKILIGRNLIKEMEPDKWVRNVLDKTTGRRLSY